jgi:hypothetical protein
VLSGRVLCDGPIPRPEESYRLWCALECEQVKNKNLDTCCEQVAEGRTTKRMLFYSSCFLKVTQCTIVLLGGDWRQCIWFSFRNESCECRKITFSTSNIKVPPHDTVQSPFDRSVLTSCLLHINLNEVYKFTAWSSTLSWSSESLYQNCASVLRLGCVTNISKIKILYAPYYMIHLICD